MRSLKFLIFALFGLNSAAEKVTEPQPSVAASELKVMQEEVNENRHDFTEGGFDDADPDDGGENEAGDQQRQDDVVYEDEDDEVSPESVSSGPGSMLSLLNPAEAKSALTDFWSEVQGQAREFTRNITPSMQTFAHRMQAAGFPAPLVHGFREIEVPAGSLLPQFVPDIPIMGPLNPASWSQEQINAALNPQVFNLMNPNTVAEIPGLGRFSIAIPPVNVEFPWAGAALQATNGGRTNLASSAAGLLPQSFPSFVKYERIPGEAPTYMNFPELGIFNPANAYENKRQLFVAGDIIQGSFDRLNDIITGNGAPNNSNGPIQNLLAGTTAGTNSLLGVAGPLAGALGGSALGGGALGGLFNYPLLQTAEAGTGLVQNIGQNIGQGLLEPVFSIVNSSGTGGAVRGILDRTARLAGVGL
ncbi:hypothetical protein GNI_103560 [Gregarina niphandrodes]|uniref:Transmembrane protein n=1 Tax=Gregarina niphandrodes TaxID=110365 RepID=A0A023B460_GRENI|nr:hypothetical protein GNI_103560 [Gregarina niphandrodes]EZG56480.1 hypothetical protein GNI_103560 [Gregarina niphandrodes]|eukprot:XP_011131255.1 hypothetical protein GNI_103560 [Gregarina niphandrodes]